MKMLSVVVPVYNAEKFLTGLFNKLSDFPEESVDIILINDGSTDNSNSLCEAIVAEKANFFLVNQPNAGVSHARNSGIKQVKSEYIWFCDPDDEFDASVIFKLFQQTLNEQSCPPGVISFSYEIYFTDSKKIYSYTFDDGVFSGSEIIVHFNNYEKKNNLSTVWNKIFKTALIRDNDIYFDEELHHSEDRIFNIHVFQKAEVVILSHVIGYRYIKYTSGTLTTKFDKGRAVSTYKADQIMVDYLISQNIDVSRIQDRMRLNYLSLICENAIRGNVSLLKGYSDFRQEFSMMRTDKPIKTNEGGMVSRILIYCTNHNYPIIFYCLFSLKIKLRSILNRFR